MTAKITDPTRKPIALVCKICGQNYIGQPGQQMCGVCHRDYKIQRTAEFQFRRGWLAATVCHNVNTNVVALDEAVAELLSGRRASR
jgi:hypothetical protein